jgi:adenylate kinase family enzyme
MPRTRSSRNSGKTISIDDDASPSTVAAAEGRSTRSKAPAPAPQPALAPKPKPARRAAKGKEKSVTIEQTTRQIENNQNLALDTQTDYVRKTNFIARCLNEKSIQKLVNQPDKVTKYIIDQYPNMNSRTGYLVAFVSLIKHTNLQVTDEVQQKFFDAMMQSAGAAQEIAKENAPKVASIMLNGKPVQWKDVLECEKRLQKDEYASRDHLLVAMYTLIPPRRLKDYAKMEVFKSQSEFNSSEEPNKMFVNTRNKYVEMCIGNYKTAKTYDKYEVKMTRVLFEVIKTNLAEHK